MGKAFRLNGQSVAVLLSVLDICTHKSCDTYDNGKLKATADTLPNCVANCIA